MIYSDKHLGYFDRKYLYGLDLPESDVNVSYTRYVNKYKNIAKDAHPNDQTIDNAIKNGLTPGEK